MRHSWYESDVSKKKPKKPASIPRLHDMAAAEEPEAPVLQKVPERLASPFKDALSGLKKQMQEQAKAPVPPKVVPQSSPVVSRASKQLRGSGTFSADDKSALSLAMQGVKRLDEPSRGARVLASGPRIESRIADAATIKTSVEQNARARLDALVAEDVNFRIEREGGHISAMRAGLPARIVRELVRRTRVDESLDLHGMTQREAQDAVLSFVKRVKRTGLDLVCIVHGKGMHSEGGVGVLRDAVVATLTGPAASHVRAFVTAPEVLGGSGALLVEIAR